MIGKIRTYTSIGKKCSDYIFLKKTRAEKNNLTVMKVRIGKIRQN